MSELTLRFGLAARAPTRSLARVTGWITDVFRLGWGALYWNTRKSWHVLRGRRGRCPCQVASDSGRAHETGCEAAVHFRSPGRFRAVCPLLARRADGDWRCSVNTEDIRPFWGRAALLLAGGAVATWIVCTLLAFAALRGVGYDIAYRQLAWPPAWTEFRAVQSRYYLEQARRAREEGRSADALLALSNAYELNPRDYAAGMVLAQLWQAGQPLLSDEVFARLLVEHPEQREQTAQAWYRALLARGDFASIQRLAGERILHSAPAAPASAWVQAYLFAWRRTADPAALEALLAAPELPAALRPLFQLEKALAVLPAADRVAALSAALARERDPFTAYHLARRLLEEGAPARVLEFALSPAAPLADREKVRLRLDALAQLGRADERAELFRRVLALPAHPAIRELLSAHLVAHPERALLRALDAQLVREPPSADAEGYPQLLAFFAACAADGEPGLIRDAADRLAAATARDSRALDLAVEAFARPPPGFRLENILPLLQPLPLEVAYALYGRYSPPPPLPP